MAKSDLIAASSFTRLSSSSLFFLKDGSALWLLSHLKIEEVEQNELEYESVVCCFWSAAVWLLQKENHHRPLLVQDNNHVSVSVLFCHHRGTRNETNSLFFDFIFSCYFSRGPHKITKMRAASNDVLIHFYD